MTNEQYTEQGLGPPSEALLFRQAQAGCRTSLNVLMARHAGLVPYVVNRQNRWGLAYDEALQAGRHGLWRAVLGYDPQRGTAFATYAYGAIMRHVWAAVQRHWRSGRRGVPVGLLALWYDPVAPDPAVQGSWEAVRASLAALVGRLPPRLEQIIQARYGLAGVWPQTLAAVGAQLGLSGERVRQLQVEALLWLRHPAHSQELRELLGRHGQADYEWAAAVRAAWRRRRRGRR
jgi:RNA polymerase sigma factor (sigma-70 family)